MKIKSTISILILMVGCLYGFTQNEYNNIKNFEQIQVFNEEFNNNTNKWNLSDLYPIISNIENSRLVIEAIDFPNFLCKRVDFNPKKDFQIEFSMKQIKGDSTQNVFFLYGFKDETGNGYGMSPALNTIALVNFHDKKPAIDKTIVAEKFYNDLFNKFTIRKIKGKFFYYVNEQLLFTKSKINFPGEQIGFYISANTTIAIDFIKIVYLKPIKVKK